MKIEIITKYNSSLLQLHIGQKNLQIPIIEFSFHSTHSKIPSGWAAFDADRLRELRLNKDTKLED